MDFDYNTMYREYFKIYEDCKRKYSFGEISESEFRKIVISATNDSLKEDNILNNGTFKLILRSNLDKLLKKEVIAKIKDNQYYYLNNYFNGLYIIGQSYDKFLMILEAIIKFLNTYEVKMTGDTASKLIENNINVNYIIKYVYSYNFRLRHTKLFKDYNINMLLLYYGLNHKTLVSEEQSIVINDDIIMDNKSIRKKKKRTNINRFKYGQVQERNQTIRKINKSIYYIFNEYTHEEVNNAYNCLSEDNKNVLNKFYNAYLEPTNWDLLTGSYAAEIYRILYINMDLILKRNRGLVSHKKNLYFRYPTYSKEEIKTVIENLPFDMQALIGIRFDINGNYKSGKITKEVYNKIKAITTGIIPRRLKKLRISRLIDFLSLYYYNSYKNEQIEEVLLFLGSTYQNNLYQSLEFRDYMGNVKDEKLFKKCIAIFDMHIRRTDKRDIIINQIKSSYENVSDELVKVLLMKMGYFDGKCYSNMEISVRLHISLKDVEEDLNILENIVKDLRCNSKKLKKKNS